MKMKRGLCLVLVVMLVLSVGLVGCNKEDVSSTKENTNSTKESEKKTEDNSEEKNEPELKHVVLNWYFPGLGSQEDVELVEEEASKYLKDKINASIKLHCFDWASYVEKMRTMIAAGEEYDINFTASWGLNYKENVARGAYVPLNDLMDKYAPKTKALLGSHFLEGSQVGGINYAIPANKEKAAQYGMLFLEDLVKKYNMDLSKVKEMEDLEPLLKTIKENEVGVYPLQGGIDAILKKYFDDLGVDCPGCIKYDSDDMKVVLQYEQPEYKAYYDLMHKWYNNGLIRKDAATVGDETGDMKAGKFFAKCSALKPGKDKEISRAMGNKWIQVELTPAIMTTFDTMGSMQAISRTSKNPERAVMFLELFNTDKYLNNLINFGIEGKHYTKVSDNIIKPGSDNNKYNPGTTWMFGNVFINYLWDNEDPNKWEQFKEFNDNAIPAKTIGFAFDAKPVKNEIAACKAAIQDYDAGLGSGTLDPDVYLPKMIKALKDAGADKIIAEKQKQLDAWLANK